jgi:hypothetical protein
VWRHSRNYYQVIGDASRLTSAPSDAVWFSAAYWYVRPTPIGLFMPKQILVRRRRWTTLATVAIASTAVAQDRTMPPESERQLARAIYSRIRTWSKSSAKNATLRTTCVATMLEGGHAVNALPQLAAATVNCRALPEDSIAYVTAALTKVVRDSSTIATTFAFTAR